MTTCPSCELPVKEIDLVESVCFAGTLKGKAEFQCPHCGLVELPFEILITEPEEETDDERAERIADEIADHELKV